MIFLSVMRELLRKPGSAVGLFILAATAVAAVVAPIIYPDGPWAMGGNAYVWPGTNGTYPLGTDMLGRDILTGLLYGARVSLTVGGVATISALIVGSVIGAFAGYYGGVVDLILRRITEIFQTVPPFVFAVVIVSILQPSITTMTIAIATISWPTIARLARGEFIALRNREFVQASIMIGMMPARIIFTQILPNALPAIIVTTSVMVAYAILLESALSFLGLGDPNVMSWGSMIGAGRGQLRGAWYLAAVPGVAIVLVVLALNMIAENLNDILNPQLKPRD